MVNQLKTILLLGVLSVLLIAIGGAISPTMLGIMIAFAVIMNAFAFLHSDKLVLRMSREEIGNFLGLTLETVSRLFSRFAREGLIRVQQREVHILDMAGLQALSGTDCS